LVSAKNDNCPDGVDGTNCRNSVRQASFAEQCKDCSDNDEEDSEDVREVGQPSDEARCRELMATSSMTHIDNWSTYIACISRVDSGGTNSCDFFVTVDIGGKRVVDICSIFSLFAYVFGALREGHSKNFVVIVLDHLIRHCEVRVRGEALGSNLQ
jgi:hypothetical protein